MLSLLWVLRVFPVDVDSIEAQIFDQLDAAISEPLSSLRRRGWLVKMLLLMCIRPATDGQKALQVPVLLLFEHDLFDVAVNVVANIIPRVPFVMNVEVGPFVGQDHFAILTVVSKRVEDMGELVGRDQLRSVFSAINSLLKVSDTCRLKELVMWHTQLVKYATDRYPWPPPMISVGSGDMGRSNVGVVESAEPGNVRVDVSTTMQFSRV